MTNNLETWVYIENHFNHVDPSSLQLVTKAKEISDGPVVAVITETPNQNLESEVKPYGADKIVIIKDEALNEANDDTIANALVELAKKDLPNAFLFSATVTGRSIAPRVQSELKTGLTADCLDLRFEDDLLIASKPSYGDNVMCEITCPKTRPQMASVRPNTFKAVEATPTSEVVTANLAVKVDDRITIDTETPLVADDTNINSATRIIALGRGAQSEQVIAHAKAVAARIGATIAVSRPLTDLPEFSHEQQIGQSGNTVAPELIINLGISGAVQYTVGMQNADTIVSVNTDENAPIFESSDYKYVGDAEEFLQGLLKQL
ncbi:electron transfer flavoprotein subunit alpha/FixB family protein [Lentilactobacillus sp. Marseille-Q4993]|uniref:electron transfer flavoprotein subunit alpha/FixB family protein n=1 Tax=Lentilactobacillus sp. Marseille-Q4993 TaxID=3039492 RepID=UPI0024BD022A|nr:electron transfer flavoprotein subunit alpha/FixB family protein [Lentilactobacillus sp. Marseille-Q4993]